jgi:serine protease Do
VLVDAIARAENSVVAIARYRKDEPRLDDENSPTSPDSIPNEFGSGVIIDRQGLILTNYHVLGDLQKYDYYVWTNHRPFRAAASVEAADPWMDLAVLKINADNLQPIVLGDAQNLKKGQIVIALGNPYAIARDGQASASWGIISNLSRQAPPTETTDRVAAAKETLHHYGTLIQTDAKLNLGTSGGALLNLSGEMIGLTTSLAALAGYEKSAGFAIPVDATFKRTVDTLKAGHKAQFGFLGVRLDNLPLELRQQERFGVRISQVVSGTPATRAGLQFGDIITHVNGQVVHDRNDAMRELGKMPVDSQVMLTVERGAFGQQRGKVIRTTAELSKKYVEEVRPGYARHEAPLWRGMRVDYSTAMPALVLRERADALDGTGCVAVVEVERDSPASKAGVQTWNFITHVGDTRVSTPQQFYQAVNEKAGAVRLRTIEPSGEKPERTILP